MFVNQVLNRGSDDRAPLLIISIGAWQRIQTFVGLCPVEISGFASVQQVAAGQFRLLDPDDVIITKQAVTGHSADVDGAEYGLAIAETIGQGKPEENLRLQWHSHVWGQAYHSPTDLQSIQGFEDFGMEWFISLVTNKAGDVTARLDVFRPHQVGCSMRVIIQAVVDPETVAMCQDEIDQKVTIIPPKHYPTEGE